MSETMSDPELLVKYLREAFLAELQAKTGWGRNEIELIFERAMVTGVIRYETQIHKEGYFCGKHRDTRLTIGDDGTGTRMFCAVCSREAEAELNLPPEPPETVDTCGRCFNPIVYFDGRRYCPICKETY